MISCLKENPVEVRFPDYGFGPVSVQRPSGLQHNKQVEKLEVDSLPLSLPGLDALSNICYVLQRHLMVILFAGM